MINNRYNLLEQKFDELTPDYVIAVGKPLSELGEEIEDSVKWNLFVPFKGKTVRKARYSDDKSKLYKTKMKKACPDFVVLDKRGFYFYRNMIRRAASGLDVTDPFNTPLSKTGWYIEVFGERYHSNEFVQWLSREEHEKEVREAYESDGNHVLILWENDIKHRWKEYCLPLLNRFLREASQFMEIGNDILDVDYVLSDISLKSLRSAEYWKGLSDSDRSFVINELCCRYQQIDFPFPDKFMAHYDYHKFMKWADRTNSKGTRFGLNTCLYYTKSLVYAKVKGKPSLYDVWHDCKLMEKCIEYQFNNCKGTHHARRFLNAMCSSSGFRKVSNLHPSLVSKWLMKFAGDAKYVFDPCAGWGGRMLACHGKGMKYVAMDANRDLVDELNYMADDLGMEAKVFYGDSSNEKDVNNIVGNTEFDLVFTSPPFYNEEEYTDGEKQSTIMYENYDEWFEGFFIPMVINSLSVLSDKGKAVFHLPRKFDVERLRKSIGDGLVVKDIDVDVESVRKKRKERLVFIEKGNNREEEGVDHVVCRICNRRFKRLGRHVRSSHGISGDEYSERFPDSSLICSRDSERVSEENKRKGRGRRYKQRYVYRCPDGEIVLKKDAWKRAWNTDNPPEESIIKTNGKDISDIKGETESYDFVRCTVCGYKASNLKRHIKKYHNSDSYTGQIRSKKCDDNLKKGAEKAWKRRKK